MRLSPHALLDIEPLEVVVIVHLKLPAQVRIHFLIGLGWYRLERHGLSLLQHLQHFLTVEATSNFIALGGSSLLEGDLDVGYRARLICHSLTVGRRSGPEEYLVGRDVNAM